MARSRQQTRLSSQGATNTLCGQIDIAAATFNGVLVIHEHLRHLVQPLLPPSLIVAVNVLDNYQKPSGLSSYFWNDVSY